MSKRAKDIDIEKATEYLHNYWRTYSDQLKYTEYHDDTFIEDALYAIGVAISDKHRFADGYRVFKDFLREFLTEKAA